MAENKKKDCSCDDACGCGQEMNGAPSAQDIAFEAHYKIEGLIRLLIKKGVFTEKEYIEQMNELVQMLYKQQEEMMKSAMAGQPKSEHTEHKEHKT